MQIDSKTWLAAGGPILLGAVLGLGSGPRAVVMQGALLPLLTVGLTLALAPALFIGLSLAGHALPVSSVGRAVVQSLATTGVVMLGLAPAAAFLIVTASLPGTRVTLGAVSVGTAAALGLRQLYLMLLSGGRRWPAQLVFAVWGLVALGLGGELLLDFVGRGA